MTPKSYGTSGRIKDSAWVREVQHRPGGSSLGAKVSIGEALTPRQLEGLRLLLTPFPEQQFNSTEDRKSAMPSQGVACFDCHSNGHQNGALHLTPDTRPEWFRHRTKTLSLRGVNIQRLFGTQRALKTIEDFTEFEQRTAYFDGDSNRNEKRRESA